MLPWCWSVIAGFGVCCFVIVAAQLFLFFLFSALILCGTLRTNHFFWHIDAADATFFACHFKKRL